jgi:hypothetical protein
VVEHDRYRGDGNQVFHCFDYRQSRVNLDEPIASLNSLNSRLKAPASNIRVCLESGLKVKPNAADAGAMQLIEICLACLIINYGYTAGTWANLFYCIDCAGIVRTVDAGLNYYNPLGVQRFMELLHFLYRSRLGRIGARRYEGESISISEYVHMRVTRSRRHSKIHWSKIHWRDLR